MSDDKFSGNIEDLHAIRKGVKHWNEYIFEEIEPTAPKWLTQGGVEKRTRRNIDLTKASLNNINLKKIRFDYADLSDVNFEQSKLNRADFRHTKLNGVNFQRADLSNATLLGAEVPNANLMEANLRNARIEVTNLENSNFSGADLTKADLIRSILCQTNFAGSCLIETRAIGSDFRSAQFMNSDLTNANFRGADIRGAILDNSILTGTDLQSTKLYNASLINAQLQDANISRANLSGANFENADLTQADLTKSDLTGANLMGANITDTIFTGADLTGAKIDISALSPSQQESLKTTSQRVVRHEIAANSANLHGIQTSLNQTPFSIVFDDNESKELTVQALSIHIRGGHNQISEILDKAMSGLGTEPNIRQVTQLDEEEFSTFAEVLSQAISRDKGEADAVTASLLAAMMYDHAVPYYGSWEWLTPENFNIIKGVYTFVLDTGGHKVVATTVAIGCSIIIIRICWATGKIGAGVVEAIGEKTIKYIKASSKDN